MSRKRSVSWKAAGITAFKVLAAVADHIDLLAMAHSRQRIFIMEGFDGLRRLRAEEERRAVKHYHQYLKRKKLIREQRIGGRLTYAVTAEGALKLIRERCASAPQHPQGKCTIVVYDIPESQRHSRSLFRRFLKSNDFRLFQKSVWMSNRDVAQPLTEFARHHRLLPWIRVFVADRVR